MDEYVRHKRLVAERVVDEFSQALQQIQRILDASALPPEMKPYMQEFSQSILTHLARLYLAQLVIENGERQAVEVREGGSVYDRLENGSDALG